MVYEELIPTGIDEWPAGAENSFADAPGENSRLPRPLLVFYDAWSAPHLSRRLSVVQTVEPWCSSVPQPTRLDRHASRAVPGIGSGAGGSVRTAGISSGGADVASNDHAEVAAPACSYAWQRNPNQGATP
jgi:hypothetical protein